MTINRRDFVARAITALPFLGLALPPKQEPSEDSGAFVCRWIDEDVSRSELLVGTDGDLEQHGRHGASLAGMLWVYTYALPNEYTFRFGRFFKDFKADSLAEAKKLAEYQLVDWLKQLSTEVERVAFAINRRGDVL